MRRDIYSAVGDAGGNLQELEADLRIGSRLTPHVRVNSNTNWATNEV